MPQLPKISGIKRYFGIDPGASGGIAVVFSESLDSVARSIPETEKDVWTWLALVVPPVRDWDASCFACIEKVSGYIGKAHPGSAMFKFGQSYGGLRMALVGLGIPFEEVTPQRWQKALGIAPRKNSKTCSQCNGSGSISVTDRDETERMICPRCKGKSGSGESKGQFKNRLKAKAQQLFPAEKVTLATADALLIAEYCRRFREGRLQDAKDS